MPADRILQVTVNGISEYVPIETSTGVSDADKVVATNASGKIDITLLPDGIGSNTKVLVASEALTAGDFVNFWSDSGTIKARKADASQGTTKKAFGYVKANVLINGDATVYFEGTNTSLIGLTPLSQYFLSATPGAVTATAPTTAGHIRQPLGNALSATELSVEIEEPIIRA